jgi:hypothetical protein
MNALDELISWAAPNESDADLILARNDWFSRAGKIFEDDRQVESRMVSFLEFYVCDRIRPTDGKTPARLKYERILTSESPQRAAAFRALTETLHGLYSIVAFEKDRVLLRDIYTHAQTWVNERRQLLGLVTKDILECRLIPDEQGYRFSGAFLFHPRVATALIEAEAKRRRLQKKPSAELVFDCANRSLKSERYRQIEIGKIYDFDNAKI